MKTFLQEFVVALLITGVMTRVLIWVFRKKLPRIFSYYLAFFATGFLLVPLISAIVGFDFMVAEYVFSLILWLMFDLIRTGHRN